MAMTPCVPLLDYTTKNIYLVHNICMLLKTIVSLLPLHIILGSLSVEQITSISIIIVYNEKLV